MFDLFLVVASIITVAVLAYCDGKQNLRRSSEIRAHKNVPYVWICVICVCSGLIVVHFGEDRLSSYAMPVIVVATATYMIGYFAGAGSLYLAGVLALIMVCVLVAFVLLGAINRNQAIGYGEYRQQLQVSWIQVIREAAMFAAISTVVAPLAIRPRSNL